MEFRKYTKEDKTKVEELGSNLHNNYKLNLDELSSCYVCTYNNQIIAFMTCSIIYERAEIIDIYVKKEFRCKNIGTNLISNFIKDLENCDNITLEVNVNNKIAIDFYKNLNFEIVSIRKNYYKNEDAYLMKKDLR